MVFQGLRLDFLAVIWIECGAIREGENLSGVGIFDNNGTRDGFGFFHAALEFAFGDGLDILVDGEDEVVAGLGLLLDAGEPALAGVDGDHQLAGLALELELNSRSRPLRP